MDERMRKMKMAQGAQWMKDQAASGMSKQAWCKEHDIPRGTFFYYQRVLWKKLLDEHPVIEEKADDAIAGAMMPPALVEIPVCPSSEEAPAGPVPTLKAPGPAAPVAVEGRVEISCGAFSVNIPEGISEKALTRILKAVKNAD